MDRPLLTLALTAPEPLGPLSSLPNSHSCCHPRVLLPNSPSLSPSPRLDVPLSRPWRWICPSSGCRHCCFHHLRSTQHCCGLHHLPERLTLPPPSPPPPPKALTAASARSTTARTMKWRKVESGEERRRRGLRIFKREGIGRQLSGRQGLLRGPLEKKLIFHTGLLPPNSGVFDLISWLVGGIEAMLSSFPDKKRLCQLM